MRRGELDWLDVVIIVCCVQIGQGIGRGVYAVAKARWWWLP